jgi:hypothetical protein
MIALRTFYVLLFHRAGPERKMVLHAVDADTARRMAWVAFTGSRQNWDVTVIEAVNFAALEVAK